MGETVKLLKADTQNASQPAIYAARKLISVDRLAGMNMGFQSTPFQHFAVRL